MVSVHAHVLVMQNLQYNIKKDDFYLDTSKSNQNDFFSSAVFITQPLTYLHYPQIHMCTVQDTDYVHSNLYKVKQNSFVLLCSCGQNYCIMKKTMAWFCCCCCCCQCLIHCNIINYMQAMQFISISQAPRKQCMIL